MDAAYSREELHRVRAAREANPGQPGQQLSIVEGVPADTPMDDGMVLGFWNGKRYLSWEKWHATAPIATDSPTAPALPVDAGCVAAVCGGTKVWIVRDGDRWRIHAGSRGMAGRRRDFATPFLAHAVRTAEQWYGTADGQWQEERKRDARNPDDDDKAADPNLHGKDGEPLLTESA